MSSAKAVAGAIAVTLAGLVVYGFSYYSAAPAVRVRNPLHLWLRPSGAVGQSLGILAFSLFLFLWLYPIRKRLAHRLPAGPIARWLEVHILAGLLVPSVAAVHAGFRFTGLIGLGYGAMFVVFLSGLMGRYLYAHIPRRRDGIELTLDEVAAERRLLIVEIAAALGRLPADVEAILLPPRRAVPGGILPTLAGMVADDFARRRSVRRLLRELDTGAGAVCVAGSGAGAGAVCVRGSGAGSGGAKAAGGAVPASTLSAVMRLARREIALDQQARMLGAVHRVFRYWHAAHMPFAVTALLAVTVHVAVAVFLGQTWFR